MAVDLETVKALTLDVRGTAVDRAPDRDHGVVARDPIDPAARLGC